MDTHSLAVRYRFFGLLIIALAVLTLVGTHGPSPLTGLLFSLTGTWAVLVWWGYALEARSSAGSKPKKVKSRKRGSAVTELGRPEWSPVILLWSDRLLAALLVISIVSVILVETVLPLRDLIYGVRASGLP